MDNKNDLIDFRIIKNIKNMDKPIFISLTEHF